MKKLSPCASTLKVTDLSNNDYSFTDRLVGSVSTDANLVTGVGRFTRILNADSLNLPSKNRFIVNNVYNLLDRTFTQYATPVDPGQGNYSMRTYSEESGFSKWANVSASSIDDYDADVPDWSDNFLNNLDF